MRFWAEAVVVGAPEGAGRGRGPGRAAAGLTSMARSAGLLHGGAQRRQDDVAQ